MAQAVFAGARISAACLTISDASRVSSVCRARSSSAIASRKYPALIRSTLIAVGRVAAAPLSQPNQQIHKFVPATETPLADAR